MFTAKDIKNLRRALNLNQRELAEKLGVSVGTIQNYEKGGVIPESKHKILESLKTHDPVSEKILRVIAGDGGMSNAGIVGDDVAIGADQEIKALRKRIKELEAVSKSVETTMSNDAWEMLKKQADIIASQQETINILSKKISIVGTA